MRGTPKTDHPTPGYWGTYKKAVVLIDDDHSFDAWNRYDMHRHRRHSLDKVRAIQFGWRAFRKALKRVKHND
jgi:hypothetical protein